jgi:hypothetical protein
MGYKSENLDRIKKLSQEIESKEASEVEEKKCWLNSLSKICEMLEKPRVDKRQIKEEIKNLIAKMSSF